MRTQVKGRFMARPSVPLSRQHPELRDKSMSRLESDWQHLLARETTYDATVKLSDGDYRTRNVTVARQKNEKHAWLN